MQIARTYTSEAGGAYGTVPFTQQTSEIRGPDGRLRFHHDALEVPEGWSRVAVDLLAQQVMRASGVPAALRRLPEEDVPAFLWRSVPDEAKLAALPASIRHSGETSARQVFDRMAGAWSYAGWKAGYFASETQARVYYDEIRYMLACQIAAPNLSHWRETGLYWAYGIAQELPDHHTFDLHTGLCQLVLADQGRVAGYTGVLLAQIKDQDLLALCQQEAPLLRRALGSSTNLSRLNGLMAQLPLADRAASVVQPKTHRKQLTKMVVCDIDHPQAGAFAQWKLAEEQKVASLVAGSKLHEERLNQIFTAISAYDGASDAAQDPAQNAALREAIRAAKRAMIPESYIARALAYAAQGFTSIEFPTFDTDWDSEAYATVAGQHCATALRLPDAFLTKAQSSGSAAQALFDEVNHAAWATTPPSLMFQDTISAWHGCVAAGEITTISAPGLAAGGLLFVGNTAPHEATLNLLAFAKDGRLDLQGLRHAAMLWTLTLDISLTMGAFPSQEVAQTMAELRPLALGYANLGALLMTKGLHYDSHEARVLAAGLTAVMTAASYAQSAHMAARVGAFARYPAQQAGMLAVLQRHNAAAQGDKTAVPQAFDPAHCPDRTLSAMVKSLWQEALDLAQSHGLRNAQTTQISAASDATLLMDCDTAGLDPEQAVVKFKQLAQEGFTKALTPAVPAALEALGYSPAQITAIAAHALGHRSLAQAPVINHAGLMAHGFGPREIARIEAALPSAFDIRYLFNQWTLGLEFCKQSLGIAASDLSDPCFDLLAYLGYSKAQIDAVNAHVCGTMTLEGAPYLHPAHLAIFDCAAPCGPKGQRRVLAEAQIRMMGMVQSFLSGGIAKSVPLPHQATIAQTRDLHLLAHRLGLKTITLAREGAALSQPMVLALFDEDETAETLATSGSPAQQASVMAEKIVEKVIIKEVIRADHQKLPERRKGYTQKALVGGQKVYLRTGEYADGRLGEIFIDLHKEAAGFRAMMNNFAIAISIGLQHGVPLEDFVEAFAFSAFEPAGEVKGSAAITSASSLLDYVFRELAVSYLGRTDLAPCKPTPVVANAAPPRKRAAQELVVLQGGMASASAGKLSGTVAFGGFDPQAMGLTLGNAALSMQDEEDPDLWDEAGWDNDPDAAPDPAP